MKQVLYNECDYNELEEIIRKRFPEVDKVFKRSPRMWETKEFYPVDENGNVTIKQDWSIIAQEECGNDTTLTYDVQAIEPEDMDESKKYSEAEQWKNYREGKALYVPIQYLLGILAKEGLLPEGNLLVTVSW